MEKGGGAVDAKQWELMTLYMETLHKKAYTNGASLPTLVAEHDLENLRLDRHESALKRENQLLMHMLRPSEAHAMVVRNFQKKGSLYNNVGNQESIGTLDNRAGVARQLSVPKVTGTNTRKQSLDEYGDAVLEEDEFHETNNPIMDKTLLDAGAEGFRVLTNFTPEEFEVIWGNAESAMTSRSNDVRRRKSATSAKDALLVTLTVMKHYQTWGKHAVDFGLKAPTLEKLVVKVAAVCSKLLHDCFVSLPRMTTLRSKGKVFTHYP
ncbi:hypothetical protein DYB37_006444 [Aphanomyces astaci]|uniref:Uncharacterized protein n=1 Tax=Aphanomyces astaci TaxID=112090 RepID=A0A418EWF3_APHAT|nr:hypothetical protein DYB37_006444 [Aphanomyces astaci]